jgi:hypothetical protein
MWNVFGFGRIFWSLPRSTGTWLEPKRQVTFRFVNPSLHTTLAEPVLSGYLSVDFDFSADILLGALIEVTGILAAGRFRAEAGRLRPDRPVCGPCGVCARTEEEALPIAQWDISLVGSDPPDTVGEAVHRVSLAVPIPALDLRPGIRRDSLDRKTGVPAQTIGLQQVNPSWSRVGDKRPELLGTKKCIVGSNRQDHRVGRVEIGDDVPLGLIGGCVANEESLQRADVRRRGPVSVHVVVPVVTSSVPQVH